MRFGFHKIDITPRLGVELCGFGPFLNRGAIAVRDRLWARAMAVEHDGRQAVVVSCDLAGICQETTDSARLLVHGATGLPPAAMLVSCTHTHSGPNTSELRIGWGEYDPPYMELLPQRLAAAAIGAIERLTEGRLLYAETPCEGIGLNREYDSNAPPLDEVLRETWRPAKPELTDTTCHVVAVEGDGGLLGFLSCFGCHPVCCCADTRFIHGDFVGVATNLLEHEHPGSVGLFLQGAEGDVNSCVVHKPAEEALPALDVITARYANAVRHGMQHAKPLEMDALRYVTARICFSRARWSEENLRDRLAADEEILHTPDATDEDYDFRMAAVRAVSLRRILRQIENGEALNRPVEVQAIRIGPLAFLASPFETFQAIKNEVRKRARSRIPLVLSLCNDYRGYAPDRVAFDRSDYVADLVPLICGHLPFDRLHEELPAQLLAIEAQLY
ncbi:neutral/alkaline non-lysosomal ceramidase N-terminal domain-containing protein [bacterium]|nr:neutral/alkaline non-lysosomal ceramidase N-terminal domain-containing protein [bacterium]